MRLVSKRTFRKWAKVLTERGLTFDGAELQTEVGNTVHARGYALLESDVVSVDNDNGSITFQAGYAWVNGQGYDINGRAPGDTVTLFFALNNPSDYLLYLYVPFEAVVIDRPTEILSVDPPETQTEYQVIRIDAEPGSTAIDYELLSEASVTPEMEYTASIIDVVTGATTPGHIRRALVRISKNTDTGLWSAFQETQPPNELLAFNADFAPLVNEIQVTTSAGLI